MSTDGHDQWVVGVVENIDPASWCELADSEGQDGAIRALVEDAKRSPPILYQEFAVHVGHDGHRHALGLFAELDAPIWVDRRFVLELLRDVHAQLAKETGCRCNALYTTAVRPSRGN